MTSKRLPARDEAGWPYCVWCRKKGILVPARSDDADPNKPGFNTCCPSHHRVWIDDQRLTWEEYHSGEHCRGCGEPFVGEVPWSGSGKGTMHYTKEERARADADEARFKARHEDCHAVRHHVSGSLTTHCGRCCPPPPLSPEQISRLRAILASTPTTPRVPALPAAPKPPTRKQLEKRLAELEAEVAGLRGTAEAPS
jgi:hypothetical protein